MTITTKHTDADKFCDICVLLGIPTPTILKGDNYSYSVTAIGWTYEIGGHLVMKKTTRTICLDCFERERSDEKKRTLYYESN